MTAGGNKMAEMVEDPTRTNKTSHLSLHGWIQMLSSYGCVFLPSLQDDTKNH